MYVPRLHLVTPLTTDLEVVRATQQGLAAGAPLVQVRCKDVTDRDRYHHTGQLRELCAATGAMCLVNDRVDLALAVAADGVHVGDEDLPVAVARRLLGAGMLGATCRDPEAARRAVDGGATYLGVGPAYATTTKSGLLEALGPSGIRGRRLGCGRAGHRHRWRDRRTGARAARRWRLGRGRGECGVLSARPGGGGHRLPPGDR